MAERDEFLEAGAEEPQQLIARVSGEEGVDPALMMAMADQESSFNSKAIGEPTPTGTAHGMFQILDKNAAKAGIDPNDPEAAARWAANYIKEARSKGYITDADIAKYYFAGPDKKQWGPKTEVHSQKIAAKAAKYRGEPEDEFFQAGAEQSSNVEDDEFLKAGASASASELAKHRWSRLNTGASNLMPTPTGNKSYEELTTGTNPLAPEEMKRRAGQPDKLGSIVNPEKGEFTPLNPPTPGLERTYTKEEMPGRGERTFWNVGPSAINLARMGVEFPAGMAIAPIETSKGLIHYFTNIARTGGKAALWAAAQGQNPAVASALENAGVTPDEFADVFAEDPVGTALVIYGGIAGGKHYGGKAIEAGRALYDITKPGGLPGLERMQRADVREGIPKTNVVEGMTPEQYERTEGKLGLKKTAEEQALAQQTAQMGPASESAEALTGPPRPQTPPQTLTHFEAALDSLHGQLEEGGAPGKTLPGKPGAGKGIHPIQAILSEYQLVRPDLTMNEIKKAFKADREAMLREIAYARAKDAVESQKTSFADTEGKLESVTAAGVGSEQTVPINRPLGEFPNSRLGEMRKHGKTVDEYHMDRRPQPRKPSGPILGSGMGALQTFYEKIMDMRKAKAEKTGVSPEESAKLRNNDNIPGGDLIPAPTVQLAVESYRPILERREFSDQRAHIDQAVKDWYDQGLPYNDAYEAVVTLKEQGKITGAQESGFYRELSKKYHTTESAISAQERADVEEAHKQLMKDLGRSNEGTTLGSGLGGLQAPLAKLFSRETYEKARQDISNIWKDSGNTLGSGPGEPISNLIENLTKMGLYHIKQGVTDFTAWSAAIRRDANESGFSVTDNMLREAWNTKDSKNARAPMRPLPAAAASIGNMNTQVGASLEVGQANVNTANRLLSSDVGTGPTSMQALTNTDANLSALHQLWSEDLFSRSGIDAHARTYFPTAHEAAVRHVNAQGLAFLKSGRHISALEKIFHPTDKTVQEKYLHDFWDLFEDNRARALEAKGVRQVQAMRNSLEIEYNEAIKDGRIDDAAEIAAASEQLGPPGYDIKPMPDGRRNRLLADPKIKAAIEYWSTRPGAEIDMMSTKLGLEKRLQGPLPLYVKFRQIDAISAKRHKRSRPIGEYTPQAGDEATAPRTGAARSSSPFISRPGRSGSAKEAKGKLLEGKFYENDLRLALEHTLADRILADTKNEFRNEIAKAAVAKKSTNGTKPIPIKVQVGSVLGKKIWEPVVSITFEGTNPYNGETHYVPNTVGNLFKETMEVPNNTKLKRLWDRASALATAQVIALPAEAVRHGFNAVAAVQNASFAKKYGPLAEASESMASAVTLGMSKMATAVVKAYKLEGPALAKAIEDYGGVGALRLSNYKGAGVQTNAMIRAVEKIPGIHKLKDTVFGDPGTTKGFSGMETRLRIVIGETISEMRPELSKAEVGGLLNDAYGTYVSKQAPGLVKFFGPFDPFVRAGTALTRSGLHFITGRDVTGKYNPMIHAQAAGTLAAIIAYNMALDDEHKTPWQHADYRVGDLILARRGGKVYRMSFSDIANGLKRGMEFTGITGGLNAIIRGEREPSVIVKEMGRGIYNAVVNRASPLIKMAASLWTGKSLAQTPSGDFYSTRKPAMTASAHGGAAYKILDVLGESTPFVKKTWVAGKEIASPFTEGAPEFFRPQDEKMMPEDHLLRVAYDLQDMLSVPYVPKIESEEKLASKGGDVQRRIQQEYTDTVRSIAREALNLPEEKRAAYVMHQIDLRISEQIITELGNPLPAQPAAFKSILSMLYRAQMYNTKAEILQSINMAPIETPKEPAPQAPQPPAAPAPPTGQEEEFPEFEPQFLPQ